MGRTISWSMAPPGMYAVPDMNAREMLARRAAGGVRILIGLQPATFLKPVAPAVETIAGPIEKNFQAHYAGKSEIAAQEPQSAAATEKSPGIAIPGLKPATVDAAAPAPAVSIIAKPQVGHD